MKQIYLSALLFLCFSSALAAQTQEVVATGLKFPSSLVLNGNQLYIGAFSNLFGSDPILSKLDITQAIPIVPTGVLFDANNQINGLIKIDNYLYFNTENAPSGFSGRTGRINLNDANPVMEAVATGLTRPQGFARKGDVLYLNNFITTVPPIDLAMGIYKIDLAAPFPQVAKPVLTGILAREITIRGNDLFFTDQVSKLQKIDLTQPNPVPELVASNLSSPNGLTLNGAFLYISEETKISRIDLTQANPVPQPVVANAPAYPTAVCFNGTDMYWAQINGDKLIRIRNIAPVFPAFQKVCENSTTINLGGASPSGGVYSGVHVVDQGDGETFVFDAEAAGVGIHNVTYTIAGLNVSTSIEVVARPIVTLTLQDTFYMTQAMPLTGIGGGSPVGGVYSFEYNENDNEIKDDGNGMTFSFLPGVIIGAENTIYYTFTDANGCSNQAEAGIWVSELTSGVDQLSDLQASLFPNPTSGVITVQGVSVQAMRVMDAMGRRVLEQQTAQQDINISRLPAGVYTLEIDLGGGNVASARVVKE